MKMSSFKLSEKASVSLASLVERRARGLAPMPAARAAGFTASDAHAIHETDLASVLLEADDPDKLLKGLPGLRPTERVERLEGPFVSARVNTDTVRNLMADANVRRLQSKKKSRSHLTQVLPDIRLVGGGAARAVPEDGTGVLIGVVDTGFDLSHPAFRDAAGNLRVDWLLDQTSGDREYNAAQLAQGWSAGTGPGFDENGHGTHVASIAGGTRHLQYEGVAPGARFLLVKTDFENTDDAVAWILRKAGAAGKPCVVNMSLGHHFGAHDGTDAEERLHRALAGPGRIIVVSAGNERTDRIHLGGRFHPGQRQEIRFDLLRSREHLPGAILTLWHDARDDFAVAVVSPTGQVLDIPASGQTDLYQSRMLDVELSRRPYVWSGAMQVQIAVSFKSPAARDQDIHGWRVRLDCRNAAVGRVDAWFNNSGFAAFEAHSLTQPSRTIGLPATGDGCIAVASHVTRNTWTGDAGPAQDLTAVVGRSSPFSSRGPTRDGRWKPEISAPGQYVTAALADQSSMAELDERTLGGQRLLTIEGTSMAAPVVTGVAALLLQKKPSMTVADVRGGLAAGTRRDEHTGPALWTTAYGYGKLDVAAVLGNVR